MSTAVGNKTVITPDVSRAKWAVLKKNKEKKESSKYLLEKEIPKHWGRRD